MREGDELPIWTIYQSPSDFPGKYVVRRFYLVGGGGGLHHDPAPCFVGDTLDDARDSLPHERGLVCMPRQAADLPQIVESWI